MSIQQILGETPKTAFVQQFYQKTPYAHAQGARQLKSLGSWTLLERVLESASQVPEGSPGAPDLVVARQDRLWDGKHIPTKDEARRLYQEGYTLLVRHAERHDTRLRELACGFQADFAAPANIHLYCTPAGQHGFGWHYDAEEVFIVQTEGCKEFELRKNTVNPWPLVETIPADMHWERETMPLVRCLLYPGDWLYIPAGYWHQAQAQDDSISLAIGLMAPAAIDVFDFLRKRLARSLLWRQRLATSGCASPLGESELVAEYRRVFSELATDLTKSLGDEGLLRDFLQEMSTRAAS